MIDDYFSSRKCTLLGVGPMSLNCIDAAIDLAHIRNTPLFLIASRRQIDSCEFGGGYVNNMDTATFADYVRARDKDKKIILARDHGGPWQQPVEVNKGLNLKEAMASAKRSYMADIDAGFEVLHIDPSIDIFAEPSTDEVLERIFELYEFCWSYACQQGRQISFEIGTEEQSSNTDTLKELDYTIDKTLKFCEKNQLPKPKFVVAQTGTRVMEDMNVGVVSQSNLLLEDDNAHRQSINEVIHICNKHGIMLKQHNTDYLDSQTLSQHPQLGLHAANVAPEFGVCETNALVKILEKYGLDTLRDDFLTLSHDSGKWQKWMLPHSQASDEKKAIICGHYLFSNPQFIEIKEKASSLLHKKNIDLNNFLYSCVRGSIERYMDCFGL
ncbi:class II D-tagatose-bisphosphate aldolase, non-catalytic subunit [Thalassomonas viridans]|uniref:Class II D-tagatose-bisphosphate aldolase, non-catalytic subunit n=2 Tax=Thalassomonas viridans TaxID=137584 RepID=A0AAF0CEP2_9GAMM|nr:class II D-tagatose-bisphosphate aldolase, non-catalytic subunit [Thalassomonas viridans]